jgi:hypothetical protein
MYSPLVSANRTSATVLPFSRACLDYPRGRLQTADSPPIIRLNCLVLGESISHAFPIKIVEAETVGALKVAIKEQKKHKFEHVDADALNLWKVPPALENDLENFLEVLSTTISPYSFIFLPTARLTY